MPRRSARLHRAGAHRSLSLQHEACAPSCPGPQPGLRLLPIGLLGRWDCELCSWPRWEGEGRRRGEGRKEEYSLAPAGPAQRGNSPFSSEALGRGGVGGGVLNVLPASARTGAATSVDLHHKEERKKQCTEPLPAGDQLSLTWHLLGAVSQWLLLRARGC